MKKTLSALLLGTSILGCAPIPYTVKNDTPYKTVERVRASDSPFKTQVVVVDEKPYFFSNAEIPNSSIDFIVRKQNNTHVKINDKGKVIDLESHKIYAPEQLTDKEGKPITKIRLNTRGEFAVKAKVKERKYEDVDLEVVPFTHENIEFKIKTLQIKGIGEFYIPKIGDKRKEDSRYLPFYVMSKENTRKDINLENGEIILENPNGIYILKEISYKELEKKLKGYVPPVIGEGIAD